MTKVAVIAHAGKSFGGGLPELRRELEHHGVGEPLWVEVPKSRFAPKQVERLLEEGAELLFVWGGDGMVQRCIDVLAGSEVALAVVPAGTANLLATNLGIPQDIAQAVTIGLRGEPRKLDAGRFNGEHFAVMAGAGFDASMIKQADGTLKERLGRPRTSGPDRGTCAPSRSRRRSPSTASRGGISWPAITSRCAPAGGAGRGR